MSDFLEEYGLVTIVLIFIIIMFTIKLNHEPSEKHLNYEILVDKGTNCQYLVTDFGVTPRLNKTGDHIGCNEPNVKNGASQ